MIIKISGSLSGWNAPRYFLFHHFLDSLFRNEDTLLRVGLLFSVQVIPDVFLGILFRITYFCCRSLEAHHQLFLWLQVCSRKIHPVSGQQAVISRYRIKADSLLSISQNIGIFWQGGVLGYSLQQILYCRHLCFADGAFIYCSGIFFVCFQNNRSESRKNMAVLGKSFHALPQAHHLRRQPG